MSTKEFDAAKARTVAMAYTLNLTGSDAHAASLLGPALDALSAARKERDEARTAGAKESDLATAKYLEKMMGNCPICRAAVAGLRARHEPEPEPPPTLASLAERVKAIEERIGGKDA